MKFNYAFHRLVELAPGETCGWEHHFDRVCGHVIWFMNGQAERRLIDRFMWSHIDSIVEGINKQIVRKGYKPYRKRAVEYALAYIEDLEIIARIGRKKVGGAWHHGFIVAPHHHSCKMIDDSHCQFWVGGMGGLGFDKPGVTAGEIIFHGPKCPCEHCISRYKP